MSSVSYQIKAKIEGYSNPFTLLKGISPGVEKPKVEKSTLEKLLEVYEKVKGEYEINFNGIIGVEDDREVVYAVEDKLKSLLSKIDYCEKDISNLVATAQMWDLDENESLAFGAYVGSLITILTERNEAKGKRTIIEIDENRLNYLGHCCRKFDVVRFGVNKGRSVFRFAKDGNELYVKECEGDRFASHAGSWGGHVDKISADVVKGERFAVGAGLDGGGYVGEISAGSVNGNWFAADAGRFGGHVGEISAGTVNGEKFAVEAGSFGGRVGKISAGTVNGKDFADGAGSKGGYVDEISANIVNGKGFASNAGLENGRVGKISAGTVNGKDFADGAGSNGGYVDEISADVVNGEWFAYRVGRLCGHVGKIRADIVIGDEFACYAGSDGGHVGEISAGSVNGGWFAWRAGSEGGCVGKISAGTVNGKEFAWYAGSKGGYVDEISADIVNEDRFAEFARDAGSDSGYVGIINVREISEKAKATINLKTRIKTKIGNWLERLKNELCKLPAD